MYGHLLTLKISTLLTQQRRNLHISGRVPQSVSGQKNRYLEHLIIFYPVSRVRLQIEISFLVCPHIVSSSSVLSSNLIPSYFHPQ
jgi:hypothetical protein